MKRLYINHLYALVVSVMLAVCASSVSAQTPSSNYVVTETVLSADGSNRVRSVQYHDGLGRPSVLASGGMNTSGKYVYTMTEYDLLGRESKIWLASAGGSSPVLISNSQMVSYASSSYNQDQYPFSTVDYDAVGRVVFRSTPGQSWHDSGTHQGVETKYLANEANSVKQYTVDTSGNLVTSSVGYYPAGTLTSEKVKDEDGHTTQVYRDMLGNVVLERRSGNNDTYYVYDKGLLTSDNRRQLRVIFYDAKADISGYKYTYDGLNRIQTATSMTYSGSQPAITNHYSVEVGYNENGSINSLKRYGQQNNQSFGKVDELSFSYVNGNQLSRVTDAATAVLSSTAMDFHDNTIDTHGASEYGYDGCGSLTYDANKGLVKIEYDVWGYPRRVYFSNYGMAEYVYSADGVRLKTRHVTAVPKSTPAPLNVAFKLSANEITSVDSTEYYGAYLYENGAFRQFNFGSGYIVPSGSAYAYKYYLKDYLGSNRVLVSSAGTIEQTTHYYPYGATLSSSTGQNVQPYKYNGKELDRMHRLDLYDYGARQYDPVIGQFTQIDPLCEKYYHISPYAYCNNNPINCIDLHGCDTIQINKIDDKWSFNGLIVSDGNDVIIINDGENSTTITYDEGEYGQRICALNLDINDNYTLGVYYVSGSGEKGLGYYVTPGGKPSVKDGSGARIPEGTYPILAPNGGKWQQPQVGGRVVSRGIRFHYGYPTPRDWTEGCFVLSSDYYVDNGKIQFTKQNSMNAVQNFDYALGGGKLYKYSFKNNIGVIKTRYGSKFNNKIKHKLYLKSK